MLRYINGVVHLLVEPTKDEISVTVVALVVYVIDHVRKIANVWDHEETTVEMAHGAIPGIITSHTFEEMQESLRESMVLRLNGPDAKDRNVVLDSDLSGAAKKRTKRGIIATPGNKYLTENMRELISPLGLKVLYATFIGLARCDVHYVVGKGLVVSPSA